jgi:hypothetical protein
MTYNLKPPAWDASSAEERWDYVVQAIASQHAALDVIRWDLAKQVHDINERAALHQADDDINGRQLGLHRATLRHYGVCIDQLGKDLEALQPVDGEILDDDAPALPAEAAS